MDALSMSNIGIFGNIMQAIGSVYSGYLNQSMTKYQAKVAQAQADLVEAQGRGQTALYEANKEVRHTVASKQMRQVEGEQVAAYAASGVKMTGSPIDVIVNSRANLELDLAMTDINDRIAQNSQAFQVASAVSGYRTEGKLYKAVGYSDMAQGMAGATKSLISAGTKYYGNKIKIGQ